MLLLSAGILLLLGGNRRRYVHVILFILASSAGFFSSLWFPHHGPAWSGLPPESIVQIEGCAAADSRRIGSGGYILELELDSVAAGSGAEASAGGRGLAFFSSDPEIRQGQLLRMDTSVRYAGVSAEIYSRQRLSGASALRDEIVFTANPDRDSLLRLGWRNKPSEWRAAAANAISARCDEMGPAAGGLFEALFTGCRDGLTAEESRVFRQAGCSHILALSGMHLGILSGIILFLLKPLPGRKAAFVISCLIILAYLFLTGFGISLVRAAVMYAVCGGAMVLYRRFRGLDVLLLSFIVLVLINPASFYTAAFRLSFLAVGGIITAAPVISRLLRPLLPQFLSLALAASLGAQLFVTPLLTELFGELYPAGIAAGIILAPMVTVFIWIGIIYLVSGLGAAAAVADWLYRLIFLVAGRASELPSVNAGGRTAIVLFFCLLSVLGLVFYNLNRRQTDGLSDKL